MNTTALLLTQVALLSSAFAAPSAPWQQLRTNVTSETVSRNPQTQQSALEYGRAIAANGNELAISARVGGSSVIDIRRPGMSGWTTTDQIDIAGLMLTAGGTALPLTHLESAGEKPTSLDFEDDVLVVGAYDVNSMPPFDGNGRGVVFVYERGGAGAAFPALPEPLLPQLAVGSTTDRLQNFGHSVDIQGARIAVGALGDGSNPGGAIVYERSNGAWNIIAELAPTQASTGSLFGSDLALHGNVLLVGAPGDRDPVTGMRVGSVISFDLAAANPQATEQRNFSPNREREGGFGASLASDGAILLVGEPGGRTGAVRTGRAYEFTVSGSGLAFSSDLDPSGGTTILPVAGAKFGTSVAIEGDVRVVGAVGPASQAQFAYEFHVTPTGTRPIRLTRLPLVSGNSDLMGESVAIADSAILLGAQGSSIVAGGVGGQGVVFAFDRGSGVEILPCSQPLNSSGRLTRLDWAGIPSMATDGFRLSIRDASPTSYSALLTSSATQSPVPSMFGNGFDCLDASSRSIVGLVSETDASGNAEFDFRAATSGVMAGATMYFQAIHRDRTSLGAATVNYSGVVSVQFRF